jgi:hypothetical protein
MSKNLKKVSGNILEKISGNFRKFPEILHKTNFNVSGNFQAKVDFRKFYITAHTSDVNPQKFPGIPRNIPQKS